MINSTDYRHFSTGFEPLSAHIARIFHHARVHQSIVSIETGWIFDWKAITLKIVSPKCWYDENTMNIILLFVNQILVSTFGAVPMPHDAATVSVNGKNLYYEVYGEGSPLVFLHGYSLSSNSWQSYVADYAKDYEVYLIDMTGHGKSDPFGEDLSIRSVAEDLNALCLYLKLEKIKAIGFSFGGDVLFQLALINPPLIESMVTIAAVGSWNIADFPNLEKNFSYENAALVSSMKDYHTSDEQIRLILEQFKNYTVRLSDGELKKIRSKVLLILGDDDTSMPLEEVIRVRKNLPNSDLWILPNVSHGAHEGVNKKDFVRVSKAFLSEK
jgi:pimeloyl-ACP methyl ester carboxylesterase